VRSPLVPRGGFVFPRYNWIQFVRNMDLQTTINISRLNLSYQTWFFILRQRWSTVQLSWLIEHDRPELSLAVELLHGSPGRGCVPASPLGLQVPLRPGRGWAEVLPGVLPWARLGRRVTTLVVGQRGRRHCSGANTAWRAIGGRGRPGLQWALNPSSVMLPSPCRRGRGRCAACAGTVCGLIFGSKQRRWSA
jgi:hypothetical protein